MPEQGSSKTLSNLSPAIIGLVGVLLGAVISTGANYLLAVRKEATDEAKDRRSQVSELRTAARLVEHELILGKTAAVFLVEKKRWPGVAKIPMPAWEKYRSVLAVGMTSQDWKAVALAGFAVEHVASMIAMPRDDDKVSDAISQRSKPVLSDIEAGLNALASYARDQGS